MDDYTELLPEEFVLNLVSHSKEPVCLINSDYAYIAANQAYMSLIEKDIEEDIRGKLIREVRGAKLFDSVIKPIIDECFRSGKPVLFTGHIPMFNNPEKKKQVDATCYPYLVQEGRPRVVAITLHDQGALATLQNNSDAILKTILDGAADGVLTIGDNNLIFSINKAAALLFGYAPLELLGQNVSKLVPAPHDYLHDRYIDEYLESRRSMIIGMGREVQGVKKSGEYFYLRVAVSHFEIDGKSFFTAVMHDLTLEKQHEKMLKQSREAAEQASRAKSDFLSQMSHELRTPLNAILGYAQLLEGEEQEPLTNLQRELLTPILSHGDNLLNLLNKIQDLANIEEQGLSLDLEVFAPEEVIEDCVRQIIPQINRKLQDLRLAFKGRALPNIRGDIFRFRQSLLHLLSNANKYTGEKGILTVDFDISGAFLKLLVSDNGNGIAQENQIHLFKPFHRLGMEWSKVGGVGVGLSLTKKFIEEMGGKVGFKSERGKGSTFWLELPIDNSTPVSVGSASPPAPVKNDERTKPTKKKKISVLYIEDNEENIVLMELFLNKIGNIEFFKSESGESGLSLAIAVEPQLIFLDIHLPGISGFEVLQALRKWERFQDVPVIALSADAMWRSKNQAAELGFTEYLTKPFSLKDVKYIIEKYF